MLLVSYINFLFDIEGIKVFGIIKIHITVRNTLDFEGFVLIKYCCTNLEIMLLVSYINFLFDIEGIKVFGIIKFISL